MRTIHRARAFLLILSAILFLTTLVRAEPPDGDDDSGRDDNNGGGDDGRGGEGGGRGPGRDGGEGNANTSGGAAAVPPSSTSSANAASPSASGSALSGMTGDSTCNTFMCIAAAVNGSTTTYVLQSTGALQLGWMAMGFGTTMANTPMVVFWSNTDGSITISQRSATGEFMPTVDPNPPRVATLDASLSSTSGGQPKFAYTIPSNADTRQDLIWAYGLQNPGSSSPDADFLHHLAAGAASLDLTKPLQSADGGLNPASPGGTNGTDGGSADGGTTGGDTGTGNIAIPLLPYQKHLIAHAILLSLAFLVFLPFGALFARWVRVYSPRGWFGVHWLVQGALAGPVVFVGTVLGVVGVREGGGQHLSDGHMKWGVALVALYFFQLALGALIHFAKPSLSSSASYPSSRTRLVSFLASPFVRPGRRPVQNYAHAVLGLAIIGIAFYQVRTGYAVEWTSATGLPGVPVSVAVVWYLWVVLLPLIYALGMFLLPKQLRQEREMRAQAFAEANARAHTRSNSGARLLGGGWGSGGADGMVETGDGGLTGGATAGRRREHRSRRDRGEREDRPVAISRPSADRHHSHRSQRDRDRERDRDGYAVRPEYTRRPSHRRNESSRSDVPRPSASRRPSAGERRPSAGGRRPSAENGDASTHGAGLSRERSRRERRAREDVLISTSPPRRA